MPCRAAPRFEFAWLTAILLVSLMVRFVSIETLPPNISADESDNLKTVYRIATGHGPGLFGLDWKPQPAFSMYLLAGSMAAFGWSITALRTVSIVLSVATLVPLYFVARRRLSVAAALSTLVLLSVSQWYLHFSRNGWENVQASLFAVVAVWTLDRALDTRRYRWFAAVGVACALGAYSYYSGLLIMPAVLCCLPFALADNKSGWRRTLTGFGLALLVFVAVFAPQAITIGSQWNYYSQRLRTVAVQTVTDSSGRIVTPEEQAVSSAARMIRTFVLMDGRPLNNNRYSPPAKPLLDGISATLLIIGLVAAAFAFRRYAIWWVMLSVPLIATQVFSSNTPDLARAVPFAPLLFLFTGAGIDAIAGKPGSWRRALKLAVIACLPIAAFVNLSSYVAWMADPAAAVSRGPAVEPHEFALWQGLQYNAAKDGLAGFNAEEWQVLRHQYASDIGPLRPSAPSPAPATKTTGAPESPLKTTGTASVPAPGLFAEHATFDSPSFAQPRGVAILPDQSIVVVDTAKREVVRISETGQVVARWGGEGESDGTFTEPWDVAVDRQGRIYVVDSMQQSIQRFTPEGKFDARLGDGLGLYRPRGIDVGSDGALYVADTGRNRVIRIDADGRTSTSFGIAEGQPKFDQPTDVAVDESGAMWVVEPSASRIRRVDSSGKLLTELPFAKMDTQNAPHLAIVGGWLVVTDPVGHRLVAVGPGARYLSWQPVSESASPLVQPFGVGAGSDGTIAVTDTANGVVRVFKLASE